MALVICTRAAIPPENGDLVVDCVLFRPRTHTRHVHFWLLLKRGEEDEYVVTQGCKVGLDLHSVGNQVCLTPITSTDSKYSHLLSSND